MKKLITVVSILLLCLSMTSCSFFSIPPKNKDDYLKQYTTFINKVKTQNGQKQDWASHDKEYHKFSTTYYEKFSEKLSWKETLKVKGYSLMYQTLKLTKKGEEYLEKDLEGDLMDLKKLFINTGKGVEGFFSEENKQSKI